MPALQSRVAILLVAAATLAAQSTADWSAVMALPPGARIRVEAPPRKLSGRLLSAAADAIVVRSGAREERVARSQISRLDARRNSHRKRNVLIGIGIGTGAGLGLGLAARTSCTGFCISPVSNGVVVGAGIAAGALVGGIVGAVLPTGGWREVYRSPLPTP